VIVELPFGKGKPLLGSATASQQRYWGLVPEWCILNSSGLPTGVSAGGVWADQTGKWALTPFRPAWFAFQTDKNAPAPT